MDDKVNVKSCKIDEASYDDFKSDKGIASSDHVPILLELEKDGGETEVKEQVKDGGDAKEEVNAEKVEGKKV